MKKTIISTLIALTVFVMGFFGFYLFFEKNIEPDLEKMILEANYCSEATDCVDLGTKCPFGVTNYVHKDEVVSIREIFDAFDSSDCTYKAMHCPSVECNNNRCEAQCK